MAGSLRRMSRRQKVVSGLSAAGLIAVGGVIWTSPEIQRQVHGPTAAEVALQREQARATDLKTQLTAVQSKQQVDTAATSKQIADLTAQADDLKAQLDEANAKLKAPDTNAGAAAAAKVAQARADALKQQLSTAQVTSSAKAKALSAQAGAAQARADSLKSQVETLSDKLSQPRVTPTPVVTASLSKQQIIGSDKMFGLYTQQSPFSYAEFDQIESSLGRDAQVSGYFGDFAHDFRADGVQAAWQRGQVPLLTWESQRQVGSVGPDQPEFSNASIINGDHDAYIKKYADDIKATGLPLIIRFDQEMQLMGGYPWADGENGNAYGSYVQMWRHVHDVFQAEGANDLVVWMWAPNRVNQIPSRPKPAAYYPGDEYVDLVGLDAYWRTTDLDEPATFDSTFGPTLPFLRQLNKPIWIAETGATDAGGHKVDWINDVFAALQRPENADIKGVMNFALTVTSGQGTSNWAWTSTPQTTEAAKAGLVASGFGAAE